MKYRSTRGNAPEMTVSEAIIKGIASDGGLYVPEAFPKLSCDWEALGKLDYKALAFEVLKGYLSNFTDDEIKECIEGAYTGRFDAEEIVPVVKAGNAYFAELYHGPTAAFKDMALSLMPRLLTASMKKEGENKTVVIIVSTSGDTGMAALKGFENVPGTQVVVFFPDGAVSPVQERQMRTAEGKNAHVFSIYGNFDDAQTSQKKILNDKEFAKEMSEEHNIKFSAANSMNIGRLIPQIVYYVWGYLRMIDAGEVKAGEKINIVVPSGNFGNILSAYYAYRMGLPVNKFICASNKNKVLTDFFNTGIYDIHRDFYVTNAPSMDILVSSNLERLLYHLLGDRKTAELMNSLANKGRYELSADDKAAFSIFEAGYAEEQEVLSSIAQMYKENGYVMDTHTAVAYSVYKKTSDGTPTLIASTASPYKFGAWVSQALGMPLEETGIPVPSGLKNLDKKPILHTEAIPKEKMKDKIRDEFKEF